MSLSDDLKDLQERLGEGSLRRAYGSIVGYMSRLRAHFASVQGERAVSGLYQGYFDMTYFALFPASLKSRGLKLAIVFDYGSFGFKVWLAARNRKLQSRYWMLLRDNGWSEYALVQPAPGVDAIVECDVADALDLEDPQALTKRIEDAARTLLDRLEPFLAAHDPESAGAGRAAPRVAG